MLGSPTLLGSSTIIPVQHANNVLLGVASQSPETVLQNLQSSADGLLNTDADERLKKYGPNTVAHEAHHGAVRRFLSLLASPLSLLLLGLAGVNYGTGQVWGALVIAIMVVLSSLLSFVQV